ncbi:S8 family serine peptidase [Accumulibacter sp.]|uniref:S8 family serine peptidase n=1 Tax=Accumulibacter sp. TaxID=2053492 RepID=UPI001AC8C2A8|nr:S8 family serine peptidase [Accumulibacter sp.]MBN8456102.1 S8 family serine peptidase [Accumulibacter sp.]
METNTYLVLRIRDAAASFDALQPSVRGAGAAGGRGAAVDYHIETSALDEQDYRELRQDRAVAVIAQPMPVGLIAPLAGDPAAAEPAPVDGATWGVHVTGALQSPHVGHGVTVAILDTGIDRDHEAFRGIELVAKDFTAEGDGDQDGHGTHVAGTIFGQATGGIRYAVAPGVRRALIGKVIGATRSATTKEIIDAIQWAVDGGAHIINLSIGFDFPGLVRTWTERGMPVDLATSRALAQYRDNVRWGTAAAITGSHNSQKRGCSSGAAGRLSGMCTTSQPGSISRIQAWRQVPGMGSPGLLHTRTDRRSQQRMANCAR